MKTKETCLQCHPANGTATESAPDGIYERLADAFEGIRADLHRIANRLDPPPPDKVGTPYVAEKLGCTTVWITEMVRSGEIPPSCVVPGTGYGKPWKFYRPRIEEWLRSR